MIYVAGSTDMDGTERIVSKSYKTRRIDPENRLKVWIWLSITIAVLAVFNALLNVLGNLPFNPVEIVIDFSIFLFVAAIILINYSPTRVGRSLGLKRITFNLALFLILFLPIFSVQYFLYSVGYLFVFGFDYFAVVLISVFTAYFFITSSWRWNRKFVDVNNLGGIRIRGNTDGATDFERGRDLSETEENVVRDYIRGKLNDEKLLSKLGNTPYSRKILKVADSLARKLKEKYRW